MKNSLLLLLPTPVLFTACGDVTASVGEFGRVEYSLFTDFLADSGQLTNEAIVTGHSQRIDTRLTTDGENRAGEEAGRITHSISPSDGVVINDVDYGDDVIPDIAVLVQNAGTYTFESHLDGQIFDRIELDFDEPDGFELVTWIREPWEEQFTETTDTTPIVEEGTQVSFVAVPTLGTSRLLGRMSLDISSDPEWAIVPSQGVSTYENGYWSTVDDLAIYFIEPGLIDVTITDPISTAAVTQRFEVTPVDDGS